MSCGMRTPQGSPARSPLSTSNGSLWIQLRVDRVRRQREQHGVAVRRRAWPRDPCRGCPRRHRLLSTTIGCPSACGQWLVDERARRCRSRRPADTGRSCGSGGSDSPAQSRCRSRTAARRTHATTATRRPATTSRHSFRRRRLVLREMARRERQRVAPERVAELARHHHFQHGRLAVASAPSRPRATRDRRRRALSTRTPSAPIAFATAAHDGCLSRFTPMKRFS